MGGLAGWAGEGAGPLGVDELRQGLDRTLQLGSGGCLHLELLLLAKDEVLVHLKLLLLVKDEVLELCELDALRLQPAGLLLLLHLEQLDFLPIPDVLVLLFFINPV